MENHALSIGALKTDCKVLAYPPAVAALKSTMDRALSGRFPTLLGNASETLLEGYDGVIRIHKLKIKLAYSGMWDETVLAGILAARVSEALRSALVSHASGIRMWADPESYMASYIEWQLGLANEPSWAFPDFHPLRLLPPLQAALEIVKARPAVLVMLAKNGRRTGNPLRFIDTLRGDMAKEIVLALMRIVEVQQHAVLAVYDHDTVLQLVKALKSLHESDMDKRILELASIHGEARGPDKFASLFGAALMAVVCKCVMQHDPIRASQSSDGFTELLSHASTARAVPSHLAEFAKIVLRSDVGKALANTIVTLLETRSKPASNTREKRSNKTASNKPKSRNLASPFAGMALLLPEIVRLSLQRHVGLNGLRAALLSIVDADLRERLDADPLISELFPEDEDADEPSYPPVPEAGIARLAPESRGLITSRQGADGWGDYLLASFASRLPGLRASTRGYLLRQFLLVQGSAEIADDMISVTLDGPPLSIVLKMAGLSGDQMRVPHLNNRLLVLNIGGML